jgi:hypothetical protein
MRDQRFNFRLIVSGAGDRWFPRLMKRADQLVPEDFEDAFGVCLECEEVILVPKICCYSVSYQGKVYSRDDFKWK